MPRLGDPLNINGMELRNRLALPPITTGHGTTEGQVTPGILGFYRRRARHVGLLVVEAAAVRADGPITFRSLGLWSDAQMSGMAELARAIKGEGAAAVVQLNHAGARGVPTGNGITGASPSGIHLRPDVEPTVLSEAQIGEIVRDFGIAAERAAEAGFDGIHVHAAHFYLTSQFLSPFTNRRRDRYGGDAAGRATFALEIARTLRLRLGRDYPVIFRINADEAVEAGQRVEDAVVIARLLESAEVDAIDVSTVPSTRWRERDGVRYLKIKTALLRDMPRGAVVPYAARIKRALRVPVIAVGKLGEAADAARVVEEGLADVVAIGRQMIADPDTAGKILSGRVDEIIRCKECSGCFFSIWQGKPMACTVNRNLVGEPSYACAGARKVDEGC